MIKKEIASCANVGLGTTLKKKVHKQVKSQMKQK